MKDFEIMEYKPLVDEVKELIHKKQYKVLQMINAETINLYWEIGEEIYRQQEDNGWGNAQYLGITPEQFVDTYLQKEEFGMNYQTKHKPCDFLQEDGDCKLGNCKPDSCKKYPYTDQPERLSSLLSVLEVIEICSVAFEIFERLKKEYGFRAHR
ncbi:MAG: DUF1016 N-terminal domain-containing protein [Lachnoclostridium sp.]|nr:DUF1016 N-terminal domain-containing protein [Lachnoclostridium sp.]